MGSISCNDWRLHALAGVLAVVVVYYVFPLLLYLVLAVSAVILGAAFAVLKGNYQLRRRETCPRPPEPNIDGVLSRVKVYPPPTVKPVIWSPTVDAQIHEVINLTLKHHAIPTYQMVAKDEDAFLKSVLPEVWSVLRVLLGRVGQIDMMKLVSQDAVEALRVHYKHFRGMHYRDSTQFAPDLQLYPYLESPEHETNFLRQAVEVLLCVSLSKDILECTPIRVLIREYITCQLLQPTIEMMCDPDYINQKLVAYLTRREEAAKSAQKKYRYSATYEDFMKHINKCEDVMELHEIRQLIITDIIQAKAVFKMKTSRSTGIQATGITISADKARSLMQRNLELYINQLGTAKMKCERLIRKLGGEAEDVPTAGEKITESQWEMPPGIPFETIMRSEAARTHFLQFLEHCGFDHLLRFWISAEALKLTPSDSLHKKIKNLFDEFLSPSAPSAIYVTSEMVPEVQKYLNGDSNASSCMASLSRGQEDMYVELQEQFYISFIWSENYRDLMQQGVEGGESPFGSITRASDPSRSESPALDPLVDDSRHRQKLKSLKMKLEEKEDELAAMPEKVQSSSLAQRKKAIVKDRTVLEEDIKKLEHYIDRTEEWFGTIGQWNVEIHSVDLSKNEKYDKDPLFIIVVARPHAGSEETFSKILADPTEGLESASRSMLDEPEMPDSRLEGSSETSETAGYISVDGSEASEDSVGRMHHSSAGWVVGRQLSEFQDLHSKVVQISPSLLFPPLPKWLIPFQKPDAQSSYWMKYRIALQSYLRRVLKDDRLQESEEVFNFLSPASENLRKSSAVPPEKKKSFHLSMPGMGMLSNIPGMGMFSKDRDHDEPKEDSVVDHVWLLMTEVFELEEWSRVLRKQLIELMQLTFGKSIDREMQEFMNWAKSEPMMVYYLQTFQASMWPGGKPAVPSPTRSDEQKARTKEEARQKFLKNTPQSLQTILGQRNCQIGFQKIFDALQDSKANKQLFYSVFELLMYALVPALEKVEVDETAADWKAEF